MATENEVKTEEVKGKPYTFREIESDDIFTMANIISDLGVAEFADALRGVDINKFIGEDGNLNMEMFGLDLALKIGGLLVKNIRNCRDDLYQLLSDTSNLSVEEVRHLKGFTIVNMIMDFVKKEEFADFFKRASKLIK